MADGYALLEILGEMPEGWFWQAERNVLRRGYEDSGGPTELHLFFRSGGPQMPFTGYVTGLMRQTALPMLLPRETHETDDVSHLAWENPYEAMFEIDQYLEEARRQGFDPFWVY